MLTVVSKLNDFARSKAVMYTENWNHSETVHNNRDVVTAD